MAQLALSCMISQLIKSTLQREKNKSLTDSSSYSFFPVISLD